MINKKEFLIIGILLTCIFLFQNVCGFVGVTPVRYEVNFEPGMKKVFYFRFMGDPDIQFKVYAEGDLAEYVGLSTNYLKEPGTVNVLLNLPKEIEKPGAHTIKIGALQQPKQRNGVGIIGNIQGKIIVNVPYPGKYVEAELITSDIKYGDIDEFVLKVISRGKEDVTTNSKIQIYDTNEKLVDEISLGENYLKSQEKIELYAEFDTLGHRTGKYKAVAIVKYDEKQAEDEKEFRIGELFIEIKDWTKKVWRGKINPFNIEVENFWNDPIENVFAEVFILNQNIRFNTPSATIGGFEKSNLTGYFDTTPIPVETKSVQARIKVFYGDKITEKFVNVKLIKEIDYVMYALLGVAGVLVILLIIVMVLTKKIYGLKKEKVKKRLGKKHE
jgi:hypothetical protein